MKSIPAASILLLPLLLFLPSCGIPEPGDPEFSPAAEAGLDPEDLVIGIQVGPAMKAYPISRLAPMEILNDEIAGEPIAITWCPLSASSAVFSRRVGETVHWFRFHPDLYLMNLLIYDEDTESHWSQLAMGALNGELEGAPLTLLPSLHTTWAHWQSLHPETLVMKPIWGAKDFRYRPPGEAGPDGLGERSLVHVVPWDGKLRAYPLDAVERAGGIWVDSLERTGGVTMDALNGGEGGKPAEMVDGVGRGGAPELFLRFRAQGPASWAEDSEGNLIPGITMYRGHVSDFYPEALWPMAVPAAKENPAGAAESGLRGGAGMNPAGTAESGLREEAGGAVP